jgi:hypothetical protein
LSSFLLAPTNNDLVFPALAQVVAGDILLSPEPNVLQARDPDLMTTIWTQAQSAGAPDSSETAWGIVGIDVDETGNSLLTFNPFDSTCGANHHPCIRKLSPEGATLWTRPAAGDDAIFLPPPARFDDEGRAVTVWANGDSGLSTQVYDPDGNLLESFDVLAGDMLTSIDLAIDPQGNLIVAGFLEDDVRHAWAARITPTGDVLWSMLYDELEPGELGSLVGGVTVTSDGRAYLVGVSQIYSTGFLAYEGSAWVAEIML